MAMLKIVLYLFPFLVRLAFTRLKRALSPPPARPPNHLTDNFLMLRSATVKEVRHCTTPEALAEAVKQAAEQKRSVSLFGQGHSSDGHQFHDDALVIDTKKLNRMLSLDEQNGTCVVEAGMTWASLVDELQRRKSTWGIHIKQTLLNTATLGGSVAVNIHARKMNSPPLIRYIRSLTLVDATGSLKTVSRTQEPELFSLVVGGYGAFGVVYSVELELQKTRNLERDPIHQVPLDEIAERYLEKLKAGYLYGDAHSNGVGIAKNWAYMTMYKACDTLPAVLPFVNTRTTPFLYSFGMYLLHADGSLPLLVWKSEMEKLKPFTNTDSCQFTSLGEYYDDVHGKVLGFGGADVHVEFQIDPDAVKSFVKEMRDVVGANYVDCTFCDLRFVKQDTESFLKYARRDFFTLSPTFHLDAHNEAKIRPMYHQLYDLVVNKYGGSFYLWDYFMGKPEHYRKAYPHFRDFLAKKKQYDPNNVFSSQWLQKLTQVFDEA